MKSIVILLTFHNNRKKMSMVSEESVWKYGGDNNGKQKEPLCRY